MTLSPRPAHIIVAVRDTSVNHALRSIVVLVCALSAGVHLALVPEHLAEGGPRLGGAFAASGLALGVVAVLARLPGRDKQVITLAALVLTANVLAYMASRTTGLPLLIPKPEEVDLLGVVTTIAEVAGALACVLLITRKEPS